MAERAGAKAGDLVLILCGKKFKTLTQLCALRLEVAQQLGLRDPKKFAPLWIVDFPLFEWDDETQRYYAVHHPFTSPKLEDVQYLDSDPGRVRLRLRLQRHRDRRRLDPYPRLETAGQNVRGAGLHGRRGSGALRLPDERLQVRRTPHGGLAFGFDRLCSLFGGSESIRDYIAFPKNNNGHDMMLDAPGYIDQAQLDELYLQLVKPEE